VNVEVLPSPAAVAESAARSVMMTAAMAINAYGRFTIALAGGSTPENLYRLLASPEYRGQIDWSRAEVFWGDERCVPSSSPDSNYRKARASLLDHVPVRPERVHRMPGRWAAEDGARLYEEDLKRVFGEAAAVPRFDIVLLGMGDDGHTASLFPGMPSLDERERWVVGSAVPPYVRPNVPRITLTLPVLNAAYWVLFLVTGQSKAGRVREAITAEPGDPDALPAARVRPTRGMLSWLLDEEAASMLDKR
jgi:6-phosphogluconolactonase